MKVFRREEVVFFCLSENKENICKTFMIKRTIRKLFYVFFCMEKKSMDDLIATGPGAGGGEEPEVFLHGGGRGPPCHLTSSPRNMELNRLLTVPYYVAVAELSGRRECN